MTEVIVQIHFYNMVLVMAAGIVTAVWGFVLYFRERRMARANKQAEATTSEKPTVATASEKSENVAVELPRRTLNRSWRISLIVTAILGALQALLGITLVLLGQRPPGGSLYYLHYVYGAIVALAIPAAVSYATSGKNLRRDILIYSIAALILVAAGARALMTGLGLP
jgi:heme A synthase